MDAPVNQDSGYESPSVDKSQLLLGVASADKSLDNESFSEPATIRNFENPVKEAKGSSTTKGVVEENDSISEPVTITNCEKLLEEAEGSPDTKDAVEKHTNAWTGRPNTKLVKVMFPDFESRLPGSQLLQSTGREAIFDMIKNKFKKGFFSSFKPKLQNMLLMNSHGDYLNCGLPVGVLSSDETYTCVFKKELVFCPSDFVRKYAVEEYESNWKMGYFFVLFSEVNRTISRFSKIIHTRMRVDFFMGETLFEALVRDRRFEEEKLRFCGATSDNTGPVELSFEASHFDGNSLKLRVSKKKDTDLPTSVPDRPYPYHVSSTGKVKDEPSKVKEEPPQTSVGLNAVAPLASSTPLNGGKCSENLACLIESAFKISSKILTPDAKKKLAKECKQILHKFSLNVNMSIPVFQVDYLSKIAKSVGAVFKTNDAAFPIFVGTCFRIGTHFVITNYQVFTMCHFARIFIDFSFTKGGVQIPSTSGQIHVPDLVMSSKELDYAILRLSKPPHMLVPCIFSTGVTIMDPSNSPWSMLQGQLLSLIGHPQGLPKQIDPWCPVEVIPQDGPGYHRYGLRREITDQRCGTYHVSNFYNGSSGSPGILFHGNKAFLVVLHTQGFTLQNANGTSNSIEQGVLFTEIVKDVEKGLNAAHDQDSLMDVTLTDLFPRVDTWPELMDIDGQCM